MNAETCRGRGHGICREELQLAGQNIGIGKQEVWKVQFDVREKKNYVRKYQYTLFNFNFLY